MINFEDRLKNLKNRRQGTREQAIFDSVGLEGLSYNFTEAKSRTAILSGEDVRPKELFEKLKESSGIKYTIGAMDAVSQEYTDVSIKEGDRVADILISNLKNHSISVSKKLQGSVALDIHIEGHSDVDMLVIIHGIVAVEYPLILPNNYSSSTDSRTMIDRVRELRIKSEHILSISFPDTVDTKGSKSIALSGGTLTRKIDIVPSCWYDSRKYQASQSEHDRGIHIYHKNNHELALNYPFTHIKVVNDKNTKYSGNLKSVIRLMKTIIADMPDDKKQTAKKLSSYDLAAIAYHMNDELELPSYMRLGLVEKTRKHLDNLRLNENYRNSLDVPDGTRKIFNDSEKTKALEILTEATEELAKSIFQEIKPYAPRYEPSIILEKVVLI